MKMVLCRKYGRGLDDVMACERECEWLKGHGYDVSAHCAAENFRYDPKLIELLEQMEKENPRCYFQLSVHEVPDEATDWEIQEYDGAEECVIYVLNGKICRI